MKFFVIVFLFLLFHNAAADVVWPGLYLADALLAPKIIFVDFLIETAFVKYFIKGISWLKAIGISVAMNVVTSIVGGFLIMAGGLIGEITIFRLIDFLVNPKAGTFHVSHWIGTVVMAVLCNTVVEGAVVQRILKRKVDGIFLWLLVAHILSMIALFFLQQTGMNGTKFCIYY